jgi:hypothetical protein
MSGLLLVAFFASALNPGRAWSHRSGWEDLPVVALSGVDGTSAAPAEVRARWNDQWLFFEFVCRDAALIAPGRVDGEDHFRIGDVVEVFVARRGKPDYVELHATPEGRQTVYAFRDYRRAAVAPGGMVVQAGRTEGGWRAILALPWAALGGKPDQDKWEFLAGRYDYDKVGGRPALSSFPAQQGKPDFHDRARYARLTLQR